jgi:hypothetical protein
MTIAQRLHLLNECFFSCSKKKATYVKLFAIRQAARDEFRVEAAIEGAELFTSYIF